MTTFDLSKPHQTSHPDRSPATNTAPAQETLFDAPDDMDQTAADPNQPATLAALKQLAGRTTSRTIHATTCCSCRAPILTGLDADVLAVTVSVDWTHLNEQGELQALLQGRTTYRLEAPPGQRPRLTRRRAPQIRAKRKQWQQFDIVPDHKCGNPLPAISTRIITANQQADRDAPPPF